MNNINTLLRIALITALLILSFALYTYLDRAQLYENIIVVIISTNVAAHLLPALTLRRSQGADDSFARRLIGILIPSLVSIAVYIAFVSIFNILTVPNFLKNISLFQFILFNLLAQFAYALVSALTASLVLRVVIPARHLHEDELRSDT
jgi:hypothetical protein